MFAFSDMSAYQMLLQIGLDLYKLQEGLVNEFCGCIKPIFTHMF